MNNKKLSQIIFDCISELYENSEPKGDFEAIIKHAKDNNIRDEFNRLKIPYEDYLIEHSKLIEITDKYIKKYKLKKRDLMAFNMEVFLGVSPKTKPDSNKKLLK